MISMNVITLFIGFIYTIYLYINKLIYNHSDTKFEKEFLSSI